mmetsp:Transcript_15848/g.55141  ORF Transcript_15848/g.55141 Transcript_15848/m.55141 type:complete len:242 (+) Transcript_15848:110-835(+)
MARRTLCVRRRLQDLASPLERARRRLLLLSNRATVRRPPYFGGSLHVALARGLRRALRRVGRGVRGDVLGLDRAASATARVVPARKARPLLRQVAVGRAVDLLARATAHHAAGTAGAVHAASGHERSRRRAADLLAGASPDAAAGAAEAAHAAGSRQRPLTRATAHGAAGAVRAGHALNAARTVQHRGSVNRGVRRRRRASARLGARAAADKPVTDRASVTPGRIRLPARLAHGRDGRLLR